MSEPTFEESMARLEEIVRQLQSSSVPLSDALKLFQEGTTLITGATKLLDEAELQVEQFQASSAGPKGEAHEEEPF